MKRRRRNFILFLFVTCCLQSLLVVTTAKLTDNSATAGHEAEGYSQRYTPDYISRFNNPGIQTLFNMFRDVKCDHDILGHCKPKSVQIDPWLTYALQTQFHLARDEPLNTVQLPASHNSFNARSNGYGGADNIIRKILSFFFKETDMILAQQEYSITDQLNMGIRVLHLDAVYLWGGMRLCHPFRKTWWIDSLIEKIEKLFGKKIEYRSEDLGCSPGARLWEEGIEEIANWVWSHPDQLLIIYVNTEPEWDRGHSKQLLAPLHLYLNDLIFNPSELKNYINARNSDRKQWPSMSDLLSQDKRVILVGANEYATVGGSLIHAPLWTEYENRSINKFKGWPQCGTDGKPYNFTQEWNCVAGESVIYGPFYNGVRDKGLILPENMQDLLDCGVKVIEMDQVSPKLITNMVWTWAKDEPKTPTIHPCVFTSVAPDSSDVNYKGTWHTGNCNWALRFACENIEKKGDWKFSSSTKTMSSLPNSLLDLCPSGYKFSVPTNSYYSKLLRMAMAREGVDYAWINIHAQTRQPLAL